MRRFRYGVMVLCCLRSGFGEKREGQQPTFASYGSAKASRCYRANTPFVIQPSGGNASFDSRSRTHRQNTLSDPVPGLSAWGFVEDL